MFGLGLGRLGLNGGSTFSQLYARLMDPSKPMASYFDGWGLNSGFHGVSISSPNTAGIPLDSMGNTLLEYVVSGTAGASTLTISSGDQTKGAGEWGAVVQHDDGTYGSYTVSSLGGGVCTVFPNVRSAITSKTIGNLGGSNLGQHYSERGYRSLARALYNSTRSDSYHNRYAAKWTASKGVIADWTGVGGIGGQIGMWTINNYIYGGKSGLVLTARSRTVAVASPSVSPVGKGLTKTFSLGGSSGFLETYISNGRYGLPSSVFCPFRVQVVVDAVTLLDKTYVENDGLNRIIVPYTSGTSGTITATFTDPTVIYPGGIMIDDVTWWAYDRTPAGFAWSDKLVHKDDNLVVVGDSWTTFYPATPGGADGVLGREIQAAMIDDGGTGTVTSVGVGGTTAEYTLANFDAVVAPLNPTAVLIVDFTNDQNQYSIDRWRTAMVKIGLKCQAIGARPVYLMPLPTQSIGQSIEHGKWSAALGSGLPA